MSLGWPFRWEAGKWGDNDEWHGGAEQQPQGYYPWTIAPRSNDNYNCNSCFVYGERLCEPNFVPTCVLNLKKPLKLKFCYYIEHSTTQKRVMLLSLNSSGLKRIGVELFITASLRD